MLSGLGCRISGLSGLGSRGCGEAQISTQEIFGQRVL